MRSSSIALALLLVAAGAGADAPRTIGGTVRTSSRTSISGARISLLRSGVAAETQTTDSRGHFSFPTGPGESVLRAEAPGFAPRVIRIEAGTDASHLEVILEPAVADQIEVSATRAPTRVSDSAASVAVLSSEEIDSTAEPALDDVLREVPGFTLFRRSDSRTANPTTQGPTLRGVGGSGASRASVLDDGVPLNDPFGGWVFWGRVPRSAIERLEVLRGGSSDLYGGPSLAGTVDLIRRQPENSVLDLEASYGSEQTPEGSLFASSRLGDWSARLAAETYRTDGYLSVEPGQSGAVDRPVASRHQTLDVTLERGGPGEAHYFLRGNTFVESRENGTPLQVNDARINQLSAGVNRFGSAGEFSLRAYGLDERYHQAFSAIAAGRSSETLTRLQTVPSWAAGLSAQWFRSFGSHRLVAGVEGREVSGTTEETAFSQGRSSIVHAGGKQETEAAFLEDVFAAASNLTLTASLRADVWRNFDALRETGPDGAHLSTNSLPDRSETAWSPRVSVLYRASSVLSITSSAYRSFRAPTLNELYRDFRVGSTLTLSNDNLRAERLSGVEAGTLLSLGNLFARANLFWMEVEDPIANVTLSTTPSLITNQRQNLGRTRSRGAELDLAAPVSSTLTLSAGYLFADSTVQSSPANPSLVEKRVPQVPRNQGTFQARWRFIPNASLALQTRLSGNQFEDDQSTLRLGGFATVDALASVTVTNSVELFAGGENLLDRRYAVGRTPNTTLGPPRAWRGGLRLRLGS